MNDVAHRNKKQVHKRNRVSKKRSEHKGKWGKWATPHATEMFGGTLRGFIFMSETSKCQEDVTAFGSLEEW